MPTLLVALFGAALPVLPAAAAQARQSETPTANSFVRTAPLVAATFAEPLDASPVTGTQLRVVDGFGVTQLCPATVSGATISCAPVGGTLPDGSYTATVAQGGATLPEGQWFFYVDTAAPAQPSVGVGYTNAQNAAGELGLFVTSLERDATVRFTVTPSSGTALTREVVLTGDARESSQTFDVSGFPDGTISVSVVQLDQAGNSSTAGTATALRDRTSPTLVSRAPLKGAMSGTGSTRTTTTATFSEALGGTAASTFVVRDSAGTVVPGATVTSNEDGTAGNETFTFTPTAPFAQDVFTVTYSVSDAKDNRLDGSYSFTIDNIAPVAPVFVTVPPFANTANQGSYTVTGTSEPGATVDVVLSDVDPPAQPTGDATASVVAGADGGWSATLRVTDHADGPLAMQATQTDAGGNESPQASASSTKDTVAPAVTVTAPDTINASQQSKVDVSGVTSDNGTATSAIAVSLVVSDGADSLAFGPLSSGASGVYSFDDLDLTALANGTLSFRVTPVDAAGNTGAAGTDTSIKDATGPATTVDGPTFATTANKTAYIVNGISEPGAGISVFVTGTSGRTATQTTTAAAGGGSWSRTFDVSGLPEGSIVLHATATDTSGNSGAEQTATKTKDTVGATIASMSPAAGSTVAPPATITVTFTEPVTSATTVTVTRGSTSVPGSTTFDTARTVATFTPTNPLTDGAHTVTAATADDRGNTGSDSKGFAVDATGPSVTGLAATDVQRPTTTTTVTGTVSETGADVVIRATDGTTTVTKTVTDLTGTSLSTTLDISTLADKADIAVTAVATDGLGHSGPTASTTLAKTPPAAPAKPTAVTASVTRAAGTADLSWTAPAGTISSYRVVVTPTAGTVTYPTDRTATTAVVSGLADGTTFTFTVLATGNGVEGAASDPVTATPYTVPGASTSVAGSGSGGDLALTWTAPSSSGGRPVSSYTVTLSPSAGTITYPSDRSATGATVTGLTAGTPYTVSVVATNLRGDGPAGSATATSAVPAPGRPTGVVASVTRAAGAADLTWTAPAGAISSYRVVVEPSAGTVTYPSDRTGTTAVVTGLTDGTTYGFTVVATGAGGEGPASDAASATPYTVPGAPTSVAGSGSGGSLTLTWSAPSSSGGRPVSSYTVTLAPSAGTITYPSDRSSTGATVSGLTAGTQYTVSVVATNLRGSSAAGTATATSTVTAPQQRFVALPSPVRAMDSRIGTGTSTGLKRGAVELDLTSRVPASATGAVLNVTVTQPEAGGFVVVYPAGTTQPATSNVNFAKGQTQANEVVTALTSRKATVFVSGTGRAHVVVDVVGYFTTDSGTGGFLTTLSPKRVLGAALAVNVGSSSGSSSVDVDLSSALPTGATGAILNVTVASPSLSGFVVVYPTGTSNPGTSNVNFGAGQVQANEVITRVSPDGKVRLTLSSGQARLIVDVVGAIVPSAASGAKRFTPLAAPVRALDTRTGLGTTGTARRTAATPVVLTLPSSVPADATGVVLNVTSTGQVSSGFVVAYPTGTAQPATSNVNFRAGVNQANEVVVGLGGGKVTLAVGGGSGTPASHLIADVVGYLK